jgi:conjugal transfer pilus assembly protein TraK
MRIAEAELFKPGVLGIAVEQLELAPGESTAVYVVREREATE